MNVSLRVPSSPAAAEIKHSILAYDRASEALQVELPIPLFLDTLALKVARVPPHDKFGALSYLLDERAVDIFRFLLGLIVDLHRLDYFLESTASVVTGLPRRKLEALQLMTELTPHARYVRSKTPRISERELVLPALRLLDQTDRGWMATSNLIESLADILVPSGQDATVLEGRSDTYFSQKVRNMISHRHQPSSFIHRGLAHYERNGLSLSGLGRSTVAALLT